VTTRLELGNSQGFFASHRSYFSKSPFCNIPVRYRADGLCYSSPTSTRHFKKAAHLFLIETKHKKFCRERNSFQNEPSFTILRIDPIEGMDCWSHAATLRRNERSSR
jgi:hypothetical protein